MKKKIIALCTAAAVSAALLSGCSFWSAVSRIGGVDGPTAVYVTEPSATPVPKTPQELIVGKWVFDHAEDGSGSEIDMDQMQVSDANVSALLQKALSSGTALEFTETGKIKVSFLSADYAFDSDATIKISGGVLPQAFEKIPVAVTEDSLTVKAGSYAVVLSRAE